MTFNLTLHAAASAIGTRLSVGPATRAELAREVEGTDGLTPEGARRLVWRFLAALQVAGRIERAGRAYQLAEAVLV